MAPDNNSQLEEATEKNKCPVLPGGSAQSKKKKKPPLHGWGDHHGIRRLKGRMIGALVTNQKGGM